MKKTKLGKLKIIRWGLLMLFLLFIQIARSSTQVGEFYSRNIYPMVSSILSFISSAVPFSMTETTVILIILFFVIYPIRNKYREKCQNWKVMCLNEGEVLLWIYVWFYFGWGINYFRQDFYTRLNVEQTQFDKIEFTSFLYSYTDSLNVLYCSPIDISIREIESKVKKVYSEFPMEWGLLKPKAFQHPKEPFVSGLYSSVGVLGYMGPFFCESHINGELSNLQLPFTYAHELAHLLGVSSEAEANMWAYFVCTHSDDPFIRYCGYWGLFPYILSNAYRLLPKGDYASWLHAVDPSIIKDYQAESNYWKDKYSPLIGDIQNAIYDIYLKGNKIPSGTKNYSEVVQYVMSFIRKSSHYFKN